MSICFKHPAYLLVCDRKEFFAETPKPEDWAIKCRKTAETVITTVRVFLSFRGSSVRNMPKTGDIFKVCLVKQRENIRKQQQWRVEVESKNQREK